MHYKNSDLIDSNPYDSKFLFIQASEHGPELLIQELSCKSQIASLYSRNNLKLGTSSHWFWWLLSWVTNKVLGKVYQIGSKFPIWFHMAPIQ